MKVLVSTTWSKEYDELCGIISPCNLEYCRRHGYEYNVHHCQFNSPSVYYNVHMNLAKEMLKYYHLVVTLDSDLLIMDHRKRFEDILDFNYDQVIADENLGPGCSPINAGAVLWKSCESSEILMNILLRDREKAERDPRNWQQQISEMLANKDPYVSRMKVISAHELNAYCNPGKPPSYKRGDFAIHFYCTEYHRKIELAKKYSKEITR